MCNDCFGLFGEKRNNSSSIPQMCIVIIGSQGSGKSFTGNQILSNNTFENQNSSSPVTVKCKKASKERKGRKLIVIDTPAIDFSDTEFIDTGLKWLGFVDMIPNNCPTVVIFTIKFERFTDEKITAFKSANLICNNKLKSHCIIGFTHIKKDDLKNEIENNENKKLSDFLKECDGRYIAVQDLEVEQFLQKTEPFSNAELGHTLTFAQKTLQKMKKETKKATDDQMSKFESIMKKKQS